jgi:hypothetical protein
MGLTRYRVIGHAVRFHMRTTMYGCTSENELTPPAGLAVDAVMPVVFELMFATLL